MSYGVTLPTAHLQYVRANFLQSWMSLTSGRKSVSPPNLDSQHLLHGIKSFWGLKEMHEVVLGLLTTDTSGAYYNHVNKTTGKRSVENIDDDIVHPEVPISTALEVQNK